MTRSQLTLQSSPHQQANTFTVHSSTTNHKSAHTISSQPPYCDYDEDRQRWHTLGMTRSVFMIRRDATIVLPNPARHHGSNSPRPLGDRLLPEGTAATFQHPRLCQVGHRDFRNPIHRRHRTAALNAMRSQSCARGRPSTQSEYPQSISLPPPSLAYPVTLARTFCGRQSLSLFTVEAHCRHRLACPSSLFT